MSYDNPILEERNSTHGSYEATARIAQELKNAIGTHTTHREKFTPAQRESLDLICTKIARLVSGDANHKDTWDDIAGYAELISVSLDANHKDTWDDIAGYAELISVSLDPEKAQF